MTSYPHQEILEHACPDVDPIIIKDFMDRMDPEYFERFTPHTIANHLRLADQLTPKKPCTLHAYKEDPGFFTLTIVAYDYFAEFATICGMLSAFGLDIREAVIFTYTDQREESLRRPLSSKKLSTERQWRSRRSNARAGITRKKVVDIFRIHVLPGFKFGSARLNQLTHELTGVIQMLDSRQFREARSRVNRLLAETLGKLHKHSSDFIHPVQIQFTNHASSTETIVDIRSIDTPAFLYTFVNTLTMRGIYVVKAKIEIKGRQIHNQLFVRGRHAGKITDQKTQEELTAAAAIMKEFTHFLTWAPDPGKALDHFDQLLDQLLPIPKQLSWLKKQPLLSHLATLFGSSDFLWEDFLRRQHTNLMPAMSKFQKGPLVRSRMALEREVQTQLRHVTTPQARHVTFNQFKDRELFRIDMKHLLHHTPLPDFSHALTNLAEVIVRQALKEAFAVMTRSSKSPTTSKECPLPFAIFGLGKFGGGELGYASDIEILCVYGIDTRIPACHGEHPSEYFEHLVQEFLRWIEAKQEGIFHIDLRLRPHGEKGMLANSLEEIQRYYSPEGLVTSFERQALIKLRYVAGNATLGRFVEQHRDHFVYSTKPWPLDEALSLRARQMAELVPSGTRHMKYSAGGLIDVEYLVQYLQLIHGHANITLRTSNTLHALCKLQELGILSQKDGDLLHHDYLFFRQLIDALRIVRGNARDLVLPPPESDSMVFLARRLGFITEDWLSGARTLEKEIQMRMTRTHKLFLKQFSTRLHQGPLS